MFQSFSPSAVVVQSTANATSSNDVFPLVIPETAQVNDTVSQVQSFRQIVTANAAATDSFETGSVSSWSVVGDHS